MAVTASLTNTEFVINMINFCIGIGLLAKPYAIAVSGWYSIISVFMAFALISYSGYLFSKVTLESYGISMNQYELVNITSTVEDSEYEETESEDTESNNTQQHRTKSVFRIIGEKAFGKYGVYLNYSQIISLLFACTTSLIMEYELLLRIIEYSFIKNSISNSIYMSEHFICIYILLFVSPIIFILNWKQLTFISKISVISITMIAVIMLYILCLCLIQFNNKPVPSHYFINQSHTQYQTENIAQYVIDNMAIQQRIFYSFLIFKAGIGGNTAIPPMVIAMKDKSLVNIKKIIFISYLFVTIFCVSFGIIGTWIYGKHSDVLILNNLFLWPSNVFVFIVVIVKAINVWASYGIFFSVAANILGDSINIKYSNKGQRYIIRIFMVLLTSFIAYLSRHHLAFMTALGSAVYSIMGGNVVIPLLLYITIFYSKISSISRVFHISLLIFAIFVAILVVYSAINGFF